MEARQAAKLGKELVVLPELESDIDLRLDCREALLLEERPNACRERLAARAGERLSTPDGETLPQQSRQPGAYCRNPRALAPTGRGTETARDRARPGRARDGTPRRGT